MRDHTTSLGGDTPGEGARAELRDPTIDQDQEHGVPRRRPRPPSGTLQDRRSSMRPGVSKDLIHTFPADAIACGDGRDTLATTKGRDDLPGIISPQLLHTPSLNRCQVIRRLYIGYQLAGHGRPRGSPPDPRGLRSRGILPAKRFRDPRRTFSAAAAAAKPRNREIHQGVQTMVMVPRPGPDGPPPPGGTRASEYPGSPALPGSRGGP